ncbi:hypothetical protein GE061_003554 [Apolygus lucorum]|uniref:XK-related protein n=1 Tax=Apolygus lucorum TaxID=248454 RepID=A0A6A4JLV8_APOLU|nr:hypothetical protein GE061_003554 [Apolygus lucorum]
MSDSKKDESVSPKPKRKRPKKKNHSKSLSSNRQISLNYLSSDEESICEKNETKDSIDETKDPTVVSEEGSSRFKNIRRNLFLGDKSQTCVVISSSDDSEFELTTSKKSHDFSSQFQQSYSTMKRDDERLHPSTKSLEIGGSFTTSTPCNERVLAERELLDPERVSLKLEVSETIMLIKDSSMKRNSNLIIEDYTSLFVYNAKQTNHKLFTSKCLQFDETSTFPSENFTCEKELHRNDSTSENDKSTIDLPSHGLVTASTFPNGGSSSTIHGDFTPSFAEIERPSVLRDLPMEHGTVANEGSLIKLCSDETQVVQPAAVEESDNIQLLQDKTLDSSINQERNFLVSSIDGDEGHSFSNSKNRAELLYSSDTDENYSPKSTISNALPLEKANNGRISDSEDSNSEGHHSDRKSRMYDDSFEILPPTPTGPEENLESFHAGENLSSDISNDNLEFDIFKQRTNIIEQCSRDTDIKLDSNERSDDNLDDETNPKSCNSDNSLSHSGSDEKSSSGRDSKVVSSDSSSESSDQRYKHSTNVIDPEISRDTDIKSDSNERSDDNLDDETNPKSCNSDSSLSHSGSDGNSSSGRDSKVVSSDSSSESSDQRSKHSTNVIDPEISRDTDIKSDSNERSDDNLDDETNPKSCNSDSSLSHSGSDGNSSSGRDSKVVSSDSSSESSDQRYKHSTNIIEQCSRDTDINSDSNVRSNDNLDGETNPKSCNSDSSLSHSGSDEKSSSGRASKVVSSDSVVGINYEQPLKYNETPTHDENSSRTTSSDNGSLLKEVLPDRVHPPIAKIDLKGVELSSKVICGVPSAPLEIVPHDDENLTLPSCSKTRTDHSYASGKPHSQIILLDEVISECKKFASLAFEHEPLLSFHSLYYNLTYDEKMTFHAILLVNLADEERWQRFHGHYRAVMDCLAKMNMVEYIGEHEDSLKLIDQLNNMEIISIFTSFGITMTIDQGDMREALILACKSDTEFGSAEKIKQTIKTVSRYKFMRIQSEAIFCVKMCLELVSLCLHLRDKVYKSVEIARHVDKMLKQYPDGMKLPLKIHVSSNLIDSDQEYLQFLDYCKLKAAFESGRMEDSSWAHIGSSIAILSSTSKEMYGILKVLGLTRFCRIADYLLQHLDERQVGLPDLVVWNESTPQIKFVALNKKPNDPLHPHRVLVISVTHRGVPNTETPELKGRDGRMKNFGVISSRLPRMEMGDGQATAADGDKAPPDLQQIYKDEVDRLPNRCHVTNWDLFVLFMSIISHVVDVALDLNLAYRYYKNEETYNYFILTILFIYFPAFVNTFISLRMYVLSNEMSSSTHMVVKKWTVRIFILIFQLAPVMRYCDSLDYALKSRRAEQRMDRVEQVRYYELMLKEDSDVALLRVFECFLEAAPQQILQLSIVLMTNGGGLTPQGKTANTFTWLHQGGSIASSLLSMAWSMASYHRSVRFIQRDKANMPLLGTAAQFLWHFNVTVSRILSISAITSLFWAASVSFISTHWVVMTVWLALFEETQFGANSSWRAKVSEIMFCGILGLVYIFTYLTPSGGATRHRYLVYYPICFFENAFAIIIWSIFSNQEVKESWYFVPLIVSGIVPFIVGIGFMAIYYKLLHPQTSSRRVHSADRKHNDVMTSTASINDINSMNM